MWGSPSSGAYAQHVLYVDLNQFVPRKLRCRTAARTRRNRRGPLPARTRSIPVLLALITVALAVVLAACGGGGSGADPSQVVKQTFAGNKRVDSGKLDLSMTANLSATGLAASQLGEPIVIKMTGPFQSRGADALPAMDLVLSATGSGSDFSAGAISTG